MIEINTSSNSNIVYTTVSGTVTKEEIDRLLPVLKNKIEQHGKARWYYQMHDFDGWKLNAFIKDVVFDIKHTNDFEKIALVGEKKWQNLMAQVMKPFTSAEIKYFDMQEKQAAEEWIKT